MNKQARVLFNFIFSSSGGNSLALQGQASQHHFYQQLIFTSLFRNVRTTKDFQLIGRQLAEIARQADFARQTGVVEQVAEALLVLPGSGQLRGIAQHYQALCAKRNGDHDGARKLLERVLEEAPDQYKARALQVIGLTYHESGEVNTALPFYIAAGKAAANCDPLTVIESQRMIAVIRSLHGDHKQALKDIENLFPLVRVISKQYPSLYYSFLNSLAVELGQMGRINEAEAASSIAMASPFASAYPEWAETSDELRDRRASSMLALSVAPAAAASPRQAPKRRLALIEPARKKTSIQTSIAIARAGIAPTETAQIILDRVRHFINPRGPPARF